MQRQIPYPYRVFISYSHEDIDLAHEVERVLKGLGLVPSWDPHVIPGKRFTEQIKTLISHCHIFIPLLTAISQDRPWVHQETGFAIALGIPVLPIAIDRLPGEMSAELQALRVDRDLGGLAEQFRNLELDCLIKQASGRPISLVQVAEWPEQRTELTAKLAEAALELGGPAKLRQRGTYSTFSIPLRSVENEIWRIRDGDNPRSSYYHHLQSEERRILGEHARTGGCDLIINPRLRLTGRNPTATRARLEELLRFIQEPGCSVRVALANRSQPRNLTIVGDWWVSESLVPGPGGYRQTVFNWHAPTVLSAVRAFDREFAELLNASSPEESRRQAISVIEDAIDRLSHSAHRSEKFGDS